MKQVPRCAGRALFLAAMVFGMAGCGRGGGGQYQGYVEGEFVYVASPIAGALSKLAVRRGQQVIAGQSLFELERAQELAAQREGAERLQQARARLENLRKGLRPSEISSLEARLAAAQAAYRLSLAEFKRRETLVKQKVVSQQEFDQTWAAADRDDAAVKQLTADIETAKLGGRSDDIRGAEADANAAEAALAQIQWRLDQKAQAATEAGLVHDTFFVQGEWVPAGRPVVALLPSKNVKVRFFVPEGRVVALKPGSEVEVRADGAREVLRARVSYVSPKAEFTPPVIYNRENRAKLVFMVEATFDPSQAIVLFPGQPVDVLARP